MPIDLADYRKRAHNHKWDGAAGRWSCEDDMNALLDELQVVNYDYWAVTHPTLGAASNPYKEGIVIVDDPRQPEPTKTPSGGQPSRGLGSK